MHLNLHLTLIRIKKYQRHVTRVMDHVYRLRTLNDFNNDSLNSRYNNIF